MKKFFFYLFGILLLSLAAFVYFKFYFPFASEAVKSGELNVIAYKGYVWKTYEGKLIMTGFKSREGNAGVQSNEFSFSVTDEKLAKELMNCVGKFVTLKYREYKGALPWRGMQRNIVYEISQVSDGITGASESMSLPYGGQL